MRGSRARAAPATTACAAGDEGGFGRADDGGFGRPDDGAAASQESNASAHSHDACGGEPLGAARPARPARGARRACGPVGAHGCVALGRWRTPHAHLTRRRVRRLNLPGGRRNVKLAALGAAARCRVACFACSVLAQQLRPARVQRVSNNGYFGGAARELVTRARKQREQREQRERVQLLLHLRRQLAKDQFQVAHACCERVSGCGIGFGAAVGVLNCSVGNPSCKK
jgi:hypothetical protein